MYLNGSTHRFSNNNADITRYDACLPYGELVVDEYSSSEEIPYKFNGKEMDEETGLYYYGARYVNPVTSLWYGVDSLAEKYPGVSGYGYCEDNPIKLNDPDGLSPKDPPTIRQIILCGMKHSKTFSRLLSLAGINLKNYDQFISYGKYTETEPTTGKITLTKEMIKNSK
jgi:RHS repeat-associated protein